MLSDFDLLLVIISVVIMVRGFHQRFKMWKQGNEEKATAFEFQRVIRVLWYLLSHRRILEVRQKGILHIFIFWGVILPLIIVILSQFKFTIPVGIAWGLSVVLDFIGFFAVISVGILLYLKTTNGKCKINSKSLVHLWLLLVIMITGFVIEGTRLAIVPANQLSSPIGFFFSVMLPDSPILLKMMTRFHLFLVLMFLALLPYTVMRHVIVALINLYYQHDGSKGEIKLLSLEEDKFGAGKADEFSQKQLLATDACVECGRCEDNCPASISGKGLSPQKTIVQTIRENMEELYSRRKSTNNGEEDVAIEGTDKWSCTTCLACTSVCPVMVGPLDKLIDLRRHSVLIKSNFPSEYKNIFKNLEIFGDTLGKGAVMREEWVGNTVIRKCYEENANEDADILFWVGCQGGLDDRNRSTTVAASQVLEKAGVNFAILGKEELCCGDPALRMGNDYLFHKMARENINLFKKYKIKKIVTHCPHCFNVFKNEYTQLGADFEVLHFNQLVNMLLSNGKLKIASKIDELFTYHDPCYLGRYNSIYDEAREILINVLASNITEMDRSKEKGFCCGAGGGNFWRGKSVGKRIEELRIEEAQQTGAKGIITSCPFCDIMFDSAVKQKGIEYSFPVKKHNRVGESSNKGMIEQELLDENYCLH